VAGATILWLHGGLIRLRDLLFCAKAGLRLAEVLDESSVVAESEVRQGCGPLRSPLDIAPVSAVSVLIEMAAAGMAVGIAPVTQLSGLMRPEIAVTALSDPTLIMTVYLIMRHKDQAGPCERSIRRALEAT